MAERTTESSIYSGIYLDQMGKKKSVSLPKVKPEQDPDKIQEVVTTVLGLQQYPIEAIREMQTGYIK